MIHYLSRQAGKKSEFLNRCDNIKLTGCRQFYHMEDNLNIICQFADTITNTLKRFVELCREEKRRRESGISEFSELQNELIKQRKKRMELEEMVRRAGNSALNDPSLTDLLNNYQERRRPQTAFTLFVANYREKVMRENPNLTLPQVTKIAKIKWGVLKKEQQELYQKKLEDMNNLYQEQRQINDKSSPNSDQNLVKKEFGCEYQGDKENEDHRNAQESEYEGERENNGSQDPNACNEQNPYNEASRIQNTMLAQEEPSSNNHQAPKEKSAIENILDLFHTQQKNPDNEAESNHTPLIEMSLVQPPLIDAPNSSSGPADNAPSLAIIDPATLNHPIEIPPTIQE